MLTDAERAQAVELKTLHGDQLAEVQRQLQAAALREDRASQFFWAQAARSRLRDGGP